MIFINGIFLITAVIIFILILLIYIFSIICGILAYRKNAQREPDDPEKKDFSPLAPWLIPLTPVLWLGKMIVLTPLAIMFGVFLFFFPFILILFRPFPDNTPLKRFILKVGNGILKLNTRLLYALGIHHKPIRFSF